MYNMKKKKLHTDTKNRKRKRKSYEVWWRIALELLKGWDHLYG